MVCRQEGKAQFAKERDNTRMLRIDPLGASFKRLPGDLRSPNTAADTVSRFEDHDLDTRTFQQLCTPQSRSTSPDDPDLQSSTSNSTKAKKPIDTNPFKVKKARFTRDRSSTRTNDCS